MKKYFAALLCALLLLGTVFGCGAASIADEMNTADSAPAVTDAATDAPAAASPDVSDLDLPDTVTGVETLVRGATPIDEEGAYDSRDEVALYLMEYGELPLNYITKMDAQALGWEGGSLEPYAPGRSIGGDHFGNYEGALPDGHDYTECDIDTAGAKSRGAKRIVFSSDGLIFYTDDHYETFILLTEGE